MALQKIKTISGTSVHLPGDDIDTDQIIPARFLKCVTFEGLGAGLFYDMRFDDHGRPKEHPLNLSADKKPQLLVSGANFGCGSSREHAPQALFHFGFRAIVAASFGEIFFGNCTALGIPCVTLSKADLVDLAHEVRIHPNASFLLDLQTKTLSMLNKSYSVEIPENARTSLMAGTWDPLAELLEAMPRVRELAASI